MELNKTIDQEAQAAEGYSSRENRFQNDDVHLESGRWWFLSLAFPMIAGTLGPVATAFSVCALAQSWRQQLVPGGNIQDAPFIANPSWLTIINAIQLGIAVTSNWFLFLNMARTVRFSIAQPITIIGWYIAAILRISMSATAAGPLLEDIKFPENELVWSQAFYYGIWAAILTSSMLLLWLRPSGALHTTIIFLLYLLLGARVFAKVEGWSYLDSVYWADVTLFTIGFGDFAPKTTLGRSLLIPYILFGIVSIGLVIDSIRTLILGRGKRPFAIRMYEEKRRKVVRTMIRKRDDKILQPTTRSDTNIPRSPSDTNPITEFERRRAEFALMRKIQNQALSRGRWMVMAISTGLWLVLWLVGAAIFKQSENPYQGWSYFDAFYFCFVAWTTIGYGDLTPISNAGRSFFVFWSLLALPIITMLISHGSDTVVKIIRHGTLRLGNITILPGDEGFIGNIKHITSKITFGKAFPSHFDSASPELALSSKSTEQEADEIISAPNVQTHQDNDRGGPSTSVIDQTASQTRGPGRGLSYLRNPDDELPTGTNFHFLLIYEIQVVAAHLKESKPHRYTFDEWAWYLKLIGEDEHNAETHCIAKGIEKRQSRNPTHEGSGKELVWSWVGSRNPLLGVLEESEWIFDRLAERLRESLLSERRGQLRSSAGEELPP
ncbi:unnamed protein product [Clonostachys chloroleuca]|uniref:Potassium channel domain-containing protein n=1 Tax=Clonostachys chloroleuca TaxID=1926264 RepID=A0AA35LUW2_9HYPO|nr:unnamed protein product [Clonostachys chloroleuca]